MSKNVFDLTEIAPNKSLHIPKIDLKNYSHIRGYHFGRPDEPESYKRHGVRVGRPAYFKERFGVIFNEFPSEILDQAIQQSDLSRNCPEQEDREVFLGLDARPFLDRCAHYARSGSERITDYAACLQKITGVPCLDRLKTFGVPCMVVVDVPMDEVPFESLDSLEVKLTEFAEGRYDEAYDGGEDRVDFAISFTDNLPTEWIVAVRRLNEAGETLVLSD